MLVSIARSRSGKKFIRERPFFIFRCERWFYVGNRVVVVGILWLAQQNIVKSRARIYRIFVASFSSADSEP